MINEEVFMLCPQLRLIPYLQHHVPQYHKWMCDPALLALTESEPLSLQEEYENQQSWLQSMKKLTFILIAPFTGMHREDDPNPNDLKRADGTLINRKAPAKHGDENFRELIVHRGTTFGAIPTGKKAAHPFEREKISEWFPFISADDYVSFAEADANDPSTKARKFFVGQKPLPGRYVPRQIRNIFTGEPMEASPEGGIGDPRVGGPYFVMIGDCNLFLLNDNDGGGEEADFARPTDRRVFEVEGMIAHKPYRNRGLATRALRTLIQYAVSVLGGTDFVAKILETNIASISLFQSKLGFTECKRVPVFNEVHYSRSIYTAEEKENWVRECIAAGCGDCWCGPYTKAVEQHMVLLAQNPSF